jgi:hypothetical protein
LPTVPLVVGCRYLIEVPSPLPAAPLISRRTILPPLRRCASRVLSRGAQVDARGPTHVLYRGGQTVAPYSTQEPTPTHTTHKALGTARRAQRSSRMCSHCSCRARSRDWLGGSRVGPHFGRRKSSHPNSRLNFIRVLVSPVGLSWYCSSISVKCAHAGYLARGITRCDWNSKSVHK